MSIARNLSDEFFLLEIEYSLGYDISLPSCFHIPDRPSSQQLVLVRYTHAHVRKQRVDGHLAAFQQRVNIVDIVTNY